MIRENTERQGSAPIEPSYPIEQRETEVLDFLHSNRRAIIALRSFSQLRDRPMMSDYHEQEKRLMQAVVSLSEGKLSFEDGQLCEVWDEGEDFQHHGKMFSEELSGEVRSVRGMYFYWEDGPNIFEVVDLDDGRSREYFINMSEDEKQQFIKRFANRQRGPVYYSDNPQTFPECYVAFVTYNGEIFEIEGIIAHSSPKNGTNFNDPDEASGK